jgi:hypothetical protein
MNGLIDNNLIDELNRMEMLPTGEEPTSLFFVAEKDAAEPRIRIALEQASHYYADAVFFRTFPKGDKRTPIPQIYIYHSTNLFLESTRYAEIHRRLWNAGIVPLSFIITPGYVKIINCRQAPEIDEATDDPVFTPFHALEKIVDADRACHT